MNRPGRPGGGRLADRLYRDRHALCTAQTHQTTTSSRKPTRELRQLNVRIARKLYGAQANRDAVALHAIQDRTSRTRTVA